MKKSLTILLFAAIAIFAVGCVSEDRLDGNIPQSGKDAVNLLLKLRTPGGFVPSKTRALDQAQENAIGDVWVLVFDSGNLVAIKRGTDPQNADPDPAQPEYSGRGSFTVEFEPQMQNRLYKLVVLANAGDILSATIGTDFLSYTGDKTYATVAAAIHAEFTGKFSGPTIPMWGEIDNVTITPQASVSLELMRALARIDVGVGKTGPGQTNADRTWDGLDDQSSPIPFELTEVFVMRPGKKFAAIPDMAYVTGLNDRGWVSAPTIPEGTDLYEADASASTFRYEDIAGASTTGGGYTTRSIYVPEADVRRTPAGKSGDADHKERMAIVVGGIYADDGAPSYYRLDFVQDGELIDVLRNTLYQFNITSVVGRGYPDPETAYEATTMNMTVDVLDWNEIDLDNGFVVGDHYFAISSRSVEFSPSKGLIKTVDIETDITDFSMNLGGEMKLRADGNTVFNSGAFLYTLERKGATDRYTLTVETLGANVFDYGAERLDEWSIAIGRVEGVPFTVSQKWMTDYVVIGLEGGNLLNIHPEGAVGERKIPVEIVSASQPTVSVTVGAEWISTIAQPSNDEGVWSLQTSFEVAPFRYGNDGTEDRSAVISVTIEGETKQFTVTQQAPYLRLLPVDIQIDRPPVPTEVRRWITVQTNLPESDLTFDFAGFTDVAGITHTVPSARSSTSRNSRFEVTANTGLVSPVGGQASYTVTPAPGYGLPAKTGNVTVLGNDEISKFLWIEGLFLDGFTPWTPSGDNTDSGYHFPWNTTSVEFSIESNRGLEFDPASSTLNGSGAPVEGASSGAGDATITPYTFVFAGADHLTQQPAYQIGFTPTYGSNHRTAGFTRGIQKWNDGGTFAAAWSYTGTGAEAGNFSATPVESNIHWTATSSDPNWLTLSGTASSFGGSVTRDDRMLEPAVDPNDLVRSGDLNVRIDAITTLNPAALQSGNYLRTASITFTNNNGSGGLNLAAKTIDVTQYAPVLLPASGFTLPVVPSAGNTAYTVSVRTNLPGWGVRVLSTIGNEGTVLADGNRVIASSAWDGAAIDPQAAAQNHSLTVDIPAYTGAADRQLEFVLYHADFAGGVSIGTVKQTGAPTLTLSPNTTQSWGAAATNAVTVDVTSNFAWEVDATSYSATDWVVIQSTDSFTVKPNGANGAVAARTAAIRVKGTAASGYSSTNAVIQVEQSASGVNLQLNNANGINFTPAAGGTDNQGSKTVTANVRWKATLGGSNPTMFKFSSGTTSVTTVPSTEDTWTFYVQPVGANTSTGAYSATVTLTSEDGAASLSFNVTQATSYVAVTGVTMSPTTLTLAPNATSTLTATVAPSNATNKAVTWTSSNTNVATVSATGVVTAKADGSATITAKTTDGAKTATCAVTVRTAVTGVTMSSTTLTLAPNATSTLTATVAPSNATNKAVTWTSSNTNVATVSATGVVTAKADGSATITVKTTDGAKTATCAMTVRTAVTGVTMSPTTLTLAPNATSTLTATVAPSNATNKAVTWTSSNTNVATVSTTGVVTAKAAGSATITVKTTDGAKTATCAVTVKIAVTGVTMSPTTLTLAPKGTSSLTATVAPSNATNKAVTWTSSNTAVATVNASGVVTAVANGTATITVKTTDGAKTATCAVTVKTTVTGVTMSPTTLTLAPKATSTLTATVAPTTASNKAVTWTSSNTAVATVNASGVVTAVANGTATITVKTTDGAKTATCAVTVRTAVTGVTLDKTTLTLTPKTTSTLTATVAPSTASNKTVSWSSNNTAIATVSTTGVVTAVAVGSATITVKTADGSKTATCAVTVNNPWSPAVANGTANFLVFSGSGENTRLELVSWNAVMTTSVLYETIAYFKWGSVIGFNNVAEHTVFSSNLAEANNAVRFNPRTSAFSGYGSILPSSASAIQGTSVTDVQNGLGDPCRLVGKTAAEARTMTQSQLVQSAWRMPNYLENNSFVPGSNWTSAGGNWTTASPGAMKFNSTHVLPAGGNRTTAGVASNRGSYGNFWSSTAHSVGSNGYSLTFYKDSMHPQNYDNKNFGFNIRCVPNK